MLHPQAGGLGKAYLRAPANRTALTTAAAEASRPGPCGSVITERTAGEVSARCHDEQANYLALNLMHDIVTGAREVEDARRYYAKEVLDHRRKKPTPY